MNCWIHDVHRRGMILPGLLTLTVLLSGCGARPANTAAPPQVVLALLDLSGSTESVRARYLAAVETVVARVPAGARLVILPVSDRSLTAPAAADVTFPPHRRFSTNSFIHRREMTRLRRHALEAVGAAVTPEAGARGTALLDSLLQAQDFLRSYPEGAGSIYIISDMVEQSQTLDLFGLEPAGVEPALARAEDARRVPDLRGAAVTVTGLEASGHLEPETVLAIRTFWEGLFERAGGRLIQYSPTL